MLYPFVLAPVVLAVGLSVKKRVQRSLLVKDLEKAVAAEDVSKVESILMFKSDLLPKETKRKVQVWFDKRSDLNE